MRILPVIRVTAGLPNCGKGIRSFYFYDRKARNRFIREQIEICGKDNVKIELYRD